MKFTKLLLFILSTLTYENLKAGTVSFKEKSEIVTFLRLIEGEGNPYITGPINYISLTEGKNYKLTKLKCQSKKTEQYVYTHKFEASLQETNQRNPRKRTLSWEEKVPGDFCLSIERLKKDIFPSKGGQSYKFK